MIGTIFDLKEFAIHDCPGVRLTVFLKGCPLRCPWCHNPEGLSREPQLMWKKEKCTGCGDCRKPCDDIVCNTLGRCWHHCPNGALSLRGESVEAADLADRLRGYAPMLSGMDGGFTLSGGEPLYQPEFSLELLRLLKPSHLCMETSGFATESLFTQFLDLLDYVIMDIKIADPVLHKQVIGVDNSLILQNLKLLKTSGKPHTLRVPLIPGITDTEENLSAISDLAGESRVELLEYNPLAPAKYAMLSMDYPLGSLQKKQEFDRVSLFRNATIMKM